MAKPQIFLVIILYSPLHHYLISKSEYEKLNQKEFNKFICIFVCCCAHGDSMGSMDAVIGLQNAPAF